MNFIYVYKNRLLDVYTGALRFNASIYVKCPHPTGFFKSHCIATI